MRTYSLRILRWCHPSRRSGSTEPQASIDSAGLSAIRTESRFLRGLIASDGRGQVAGSAASDVMGQDGLQAAADFSTVVRPNALAPIAVATRLRAQEVE